MKFYVFKIKEKSCSFSMHFKHDDEEEKNIFFFENDVVIYMGYRITNDIYANDLHCSQYCPVYIKLHKHRYLTIKF